MNSQIQTLISLLLLTFATTIHASCYFILFIFLHLLCRPRHATTNNLPTPPGPTGWPIIGSIPIMGPLAHRKLAHLAKKHNANSLMSLSLGTTPVIISSQPDTAKQILSNTAFSDRPIKSSARLLMFERAMGFAPSGEYYRRLRRIAATNFFSSRRVASSENRRQKVIADMMESVRGKMVESGKVALREILQRGSLDSVVGSVFGTSLGEAEKKELVEMVGEGYELIGRFNLEDHFPFGRIFDLYGVGRRCSDLASRVKVLISRVMEERRNDGELKKNDDFLGVLLSLPSEEKLYDLDIIAVLWEMIFRGTDVVAILIEWIMARLVLHPNIQYKTQQEISAVVGQRPVKDSDIQNLVYLQTVVKEVLRLHPPGPLLSWARLAIHDVQIGKFHVAAGTTAMVNMWAITHDESIWKDPWTFSPERFVNEYVSVMGSDLRLAPFGSGRRVCPGRALGLATVHLWVARFLQEYTWVSSEEVQLSECLRLSMEMKKPLVCRAVRRE